MTIEWENKNIKIPDEEIETAKKNLGLSTQEAIEMWLEDEGYLDNPEQDALDKKAKASQITATIHQAKSDKAKTQRERVMKPDPTKEGIIQAVAQVIQEICGNAEIVNKTKLIDFSFEDENYELNLIRKRKPKK